MNASQKLDHYLDSFRARLRKLTLLQGAAVVTFTLLVLSTIGAWFSADSGFAGNTTNVFRIVLILGLAAVAVRFLVDPLQKLKQGVSGQVETRVPEFNGRVATYVQEKSTNNPFVDLLAEDALKISDVYPVEEQVEPRELQLAGGALAAAAILFLYLLVAGPNFLNYGMRNLLAGWAFNDLLPPQTITVTPGDESVRRGANVRVTAVMAGFDPDAATIHITMADGNAQDVAMVQSPLGFEFTFFSMQQNMSYYVSSSGGLRSPEFDISVLDVPGIESLSLTYNYPEWTERDPETFTQGDVRALSETRIDLTVTTTAPLPGGRLVMNQASREELNIVGNQGSSAFTVLEEGEYYIAAVVGGEEVRISDDYFIRLNEDGKPVIEIVKPGGDYNASNIEEVKLNIDATDDYGLASLALKYSVNGGEFQTIDLSEANSREINAEYLLMLENMKARATEAVTANVGQFNIQLTDEPAPIDGDEPVNDPAEIRDEVTQGTTESADTSSEIPLQPGDLITYYAEGSDRSSTVRTDMFFINVQPYNRRYSQSQLSGGGGGGGGGQQQDEISQRQRQIIVSTWNLIRDKAEDEGNEQVDINSKLLSDLQLTLAEQAATLAERTRARQLDGDPQIEEFVNNMEQAVQRMHPASEQLAEVNLDEAIQPAQEALQYLLRAESVFNDITLTQQQGGGGGGGGGRAQQDLAEMFELEMDLELNQYETGNQASQQSQQEEAEDIMKQLDELAKRQEQLANNLRNQQQLTDAQRWQQEMLRREAEELQEQLNQLQRQKQQQNGQQQANNGQQGEQQQGQQGQQGQPGQPGQGQTGQQQGGQQGGEQQNGEPGEQAGQSEQIAQSELQRRMESAIRAMNQASEALQGNASPEELQQAADEASRQLQEARDQVAAEQLAGMQQTFANMAQTGEQMTQEQQRIEQALQDAALRATKDRDSGKDPNSTGLTMQESMALAEQGKALAQELQELQQQMTAAQQNFSDQVPDAAANELERAATDITERQLEAAVSETATYVEVGYNLYITSQQSAVTQAMRDLEQRLARANDLVEQASAPGDSDLDRARRQAEDLRAQLQQLAQNGQPGEGQGQGQQQDPNGSPSDQPGQQQGQGQQGQGGQQQGGGGGFGDRFGFGPRNLGGAWDGRDDFFDGPITLPDTFYDNIGDLTQIARSAINDMDLSPEEMEELYNLIRQLEGEQVNRNESILAQEYGEMLALVEQLEAGLKLDEDDRGGNVRTATSDQVPEEYQESVAEYFRRLSREE